MLFLLTDNIVIHEPMVSKLQDSAGFSGQLLALGVAQGVVRSSRGAL